MISSLFIRTCMSLLLSIGLLSTAYAQTIPTLPTLPNSDSITLTSDTSTPHPLQDINLSIESYSFDLTQSNITWYVNGKSVSSGIGDISYGTTMGPLGTSLDIKVIASTPNGPVSAQQTFSASTVDILWQARSYTPLFYKGKALLPNSGDVTLVAIPQFSANGLKAGSQNYSYKWEKDGQVLGDVSGYGDDSITIQGSILVRPFTITVTVTASDGTSGTASTFISNQLPKVVLYEDNPLYGTLYNNALTSSYSLTNQEVHLRAVPYFFSTTAFHTVSPLQFTWTISNGAPVTKSDENIVLRQPEGTSGGQSGVAVSVQNPNRILQSDTANTTILFSTN